VLALVVTSVAERRLAASAGQSRRASIASPELGSKVAAPRTAMPARMAFR
jgi:hypothetical protein